MARRNTGLGQTGLASTSRQHDEEGESAKTSDRTKLKELLTFYREIRKTD